MTTTDKPKKLPDLYEFVKRCSEDIPKVRALLLWAETVGYTAARPDRDAVTRRRDATEPRTPIVGDQVPGEKYDLGPAYGDHHARTAIKDAGPRIRKAETLLVTAAFGITAPRIISADRLTVDVLVATLDRSLTAVAELDRVHAYEDGEKPPIRDLALERTVGDAWAQLNWARKRLDAVFNDPIDDVTKAPPLCWVCEAAPAAVRKHDRKPTEGGRCSACARWKRRNNGQEKPRSLTKADAITAKAYQAKRTRNGIGYGDESLSHALKIE